MRVVRPKRTRTRTRARRGGGRSRARVAAPPRPAQELSHRVEPELDDDDDDDDVMVLALPRCFTKRCLVQNTFTFFVSVVLGLALFIGLRDADARSPGAYASLLKRLTDVTTSSSAAAVQSASGAPSKEDKALLGARARARLDAIAQLGSGLVYAPPAYAYSGVFAKNAAAAAAERFSRPGSHDEHSVHERAVPQKKPSQKEQQQRKPNEANAPRSGTDERRESPRDTGKLERCRCVSDSWGFAAHTWEHWPKTVSLSAKGIEIVQRFCQAEAEGTDHVVKKLRNTVIGVVSRTTHMAKRDLQKQCAVCLGQLACEAAKRGVRDPRMVRRKKKKAKKTTKKKQQQQQEQMWR